MADPVRDFLMDANGDLANVNGDFATVAGVLAVPQGIKIRLRMFLGECILDESQGVDYLNQILIKGPDSLVVRELLREAIIDTPDVTDTIGAQLSGPDSSRNASIDFQVATAYSSNPLAGSVSVLT